MLYLKLLAALRKKKTLKKGIQFTLMIVGQLGSGRLTFINTLCGQDIIDALVTIPEPEDDSDVRELVLRHELVELEDNEGVKIQLNLIDTPGFGDLVDNEFNFQIVQDYIKRQYDDILLEELRVRRNPRSKDGRVHCLLYLVNPTGHGLKEIDVKFMQGVCGLVNVIPVIAKADLLTPAELALNKRLISEDLAFYDIRLYSFPCDLDADDEEIVKYNEYLRSKLPFAVIGANSAKTLADGLVVRVRQLAHGEVNVEDDTVLDFPLLRNTLLITHLNDLKELTHDVLYENYRAEALSGEDYENGNRTYNDTYREGSYVESEGDRSQVVAREEQIRLEEERLRKFEERVQLDLANKRKELEERERELREIEERLERQAHSEAAEA